VDAIERANGILERYADLARAELPTGVPVFDAHVHLGEDIDGMVGDRDELLAIQRAYGIERSFVFCLDEPDRHPSFRAANDRTLAHATSAPGELLPFVRLDLDEGPVEEATRCLDLGARGIKLHPRAQRFLPDDPRLEPVFALAAERRVPVLIHGGRGLPPIADSLGRLLDRHAPPALIVAHAGIVDLAAMARNFAGRAGVFFDTSVWSPLDLFDLYRLVPPEQVVYASDYPYGRQPNSLLMAVRTARASGLDDAQLRAVFHDTAGRMADGAEPVQPTTPRGTTELSHPVTFLRIHQYLTMASAMLWMRQPSDTFGVLGLALNACDERSNGYRQQTE
jgi:predicted TIM-barrel fold metal-dependent hydrolase